MKVMFAIGSALLLAGCTPDDPAEPLRAEPGEEWSGGDTTVFDTTSNAYTLSARNLSFDRRAHFFTGNSFFNDLWVQSPSSTTARDGLGPLFNAKSCSSCHLHDGRGRPPIAPEERVVSVLLRLSVPGEDAHGGPTADPVYGGQLQPNALPDVPAEGEVRVAWEEVPGEYADGTPYSLRRPTWRIEDLAYGPLADGILTSPRVAPHMVGLGLLAAIDAADLEALADPDDADGDGVSGRPNHVWSETAQAPVLGRFGWKANQPDLDHQTAGAFLGDLGITSDLHPDQDCSADQAECLAQYDQGVEEGLPEADDMVMDRVVYYSHLLAVPGRRDVGERTVLRGRQRFEEAGCAACHVRTHVTGELPDYPELSDQQIWPYTDLLLHDLGPELADGRPDFEADGQEWRTPPLWGLGLLPIVNDHDLLLHDGRARGFAEAILWHGGEAEVSREAFRTLDEAGRDELLAFLDSL
jgi:CxxC motif-containing protein (DUF1111 family)